MWTFRNSLENERLDDLRFSSPFSKGTSELNLHFGVPAVNFWGCKTCNVLRFAYLPLALTLILSLILVFGANREKLKCSRLKVVQVHFSTFSSSSRTIRQNSTNETFTSWSWNYHLHCILKHFTFTFLSFSWHLNPALLTRTRSVASW